MSTGTRSNQLATALAVALTASRRGEAAEKDVEAAVCALVDSEKEAGQSVERIIIAIKQIARNLGLSAHMFVHRSEDPIQDADAILTRAVSCCVRHYYRSTPVQR